MFEHLQQLGGSPANFKSGHKLLGHHYDYGDPGEQAEGIGKRIRQGAGGSDKIEPGAQVKGHYHIPKGVSIGQRSTIFVDDRSGTGGRWEVEIDDITGFPGAIHNQNMIRQDRADVTGAKFFGVCVRRV